MSRQPVSLLARTVLVAANLVVIQSVTASTWHVDDDNCPGPGDGSTCNPFCTIQAAVDAAAPNGDLILVHDGVYPDGVDLYTKNVEIRSLNGPAGTVLTGGGSTSGLLAAMQIDGGQDASTVIRGLTFTNTTLPKRGMYIRTAGPVVENCIFEDIAVEVPEGGGAAACLIDSDAVFNDCVFRNNQNTYYRGVGGAVSISSLDSTIDETSSFNCCLFEDNRTGIAGGAVYISNRDESSTHATFDGCLFRHNMLVDAYVGELNNLGLSVFVEYGGSRFVDCTFRDHSNGYWGGAPVAMYNGPESTYFENCVFEHNHDGLGKYPTGLLVSRYGGFGGPAGAAGSANVRNCRFENNTGYSALWAVGANTTLVMMDSQFINNTADAGAAALRLQLSDSAIKAWIHNCLFQGNSGLGQQEPGAVSSQGGLFQNCLFVDNHQTNLDGNEGMMTVSYSVLRSCTFYNNTAANGAPVVRVSWAGSNVLNSIIWGPGGAQQIAVNDVQYCDIVGGYASGTNIIDTDPMFVDPDGPDDDLSTWQDNDFSLLPGSPCIDSAKTDYLGGLEYDFAGNPRRIDDPNKTDCEPFGAGNCGDAPLPDMGAFEGPPGDPLIIDPISGNGCSPFVPIDVDDDGVPNDADVCDGFDDCLDTDADGTPDGCDDCPNDANKTDPGACGCGAADTDSDGDGAADCTDGCPDEPAKVDPGLCGCGVPEVDTDADGICDNVDNCPANPNPGQEDNDNDGLGDVCDNHPPVASAGDDQTVDDGSAVTLEGSASSDPDGDPVTYYWETDCPGGSFDDPTLQSPTLTIDSSSGCDITCIVTVTIDDGLAQDSDSATITVVDATAPTLDCPADITVSNEVGQCGAIVDYLAPAATDNCPGVATSQTAGLASGSFFPVGGTTETYVATDVAGHTTECSFTIQVVDAEPPTIACPADATLECPADVSVAANGSATAADNCSVASVLPSDASTAGCGNTETIMRTWTATDGAGNSTSCDQRISVTDMAAPTITNFDGSPLLAPIGSPVDFQVLFRDACGAPHFVVWDFGDGSPLFVVDPEASPAVASYAYSLADIYTVTVSVTDDCGNAASSNLMVVAYDPAAGFTTGGGWFVPDSESSIDGVPVTDTVSRANFGFIVKYKQGATTPDGNLEFIYQAGDINLHSSDMEWLVIQSATKVRFKGQATINGEGLYTFKVTAEDNGEPGTNDTFQIEIWTGVVDTENDPPTPKHKAGNVLGGGNIKIHQ